MRTEVIIKSSKVQIVLIPDVSNEMELLALKTMAKCNPNCTFIESQTSILTEVVKNILIIESTCDKENI